MEKKEAGRNLENVQPSIIAAVILSVFVVFELFSLVGWLQGPTSFLPNPIDILLGFVSCVAGVLGIYGLSRGRAEGKHLALLASALATVLGCYGLIVVLSITNLNQASLVLSLAEVFLGPLAVLEVRATFKQPDGRGSASLFQNERSVDGSFLIEAVDVKKEYCIGPTVVPAINGISINVRKGEFVSIMGPSGSGKSTLLNLLGALDRPSSGQVLIGGEDISRLDDKGLARLRNEKIGFVFQAYNLISRSSVYRNMELPALVGGRSREERLKKVGDLLDIVGLGDKGPRKPKTLSGGEQQRVAIARALINDPEIVFADEPTGNVDSKTGSGIMRFLRKLNSEREATIIVVTHDLEVAKMTDKIIYLKDGKMAREEVVGGRLNE